LIRCGRNEAWIQTWKQGAATPCFRRKSISLSPIEVRQSIVEKTEAEGKAVVGCKELIKVYEGKISFCGNKGLQPLVSKGVI